MSSCDAACDEPAGDCRCQGWSLLDSPAVDWALLDAHEAERAHRFVRPELTRRYVAAHVGMRRVLGQRLGVAASDLQFKTDAFGKPHLMGPQRLHFSLSHCGDQALLAFSEQHEVGVDIEAVRPTASLTPELLAWTLAAGEIAHLQALPTQAHGAFFTSRWVAKEAIVKCLGMGLVMPLPQLSLPPSASRGVVPSPDGRSVGWQFVAAPAGHVAAMAWLVQ